MPITLIKRGLLLIFILNLSLATAQNLVPGGIYAGSNRTLNCTSGSCTTLSADFHESTETNARYNVMSLPMDPVVVTLPSSISLDDSYSPIIDLGFTFCYFGEEKTQIVIGDNGLISFNLDYSNVAPGGAQWQINQNWDVPSSNLPEDAVFGAFHDLYIEEGGEITYGVTGIAPFRAFVINYRSVAQYNATNGCVEPTTQQIVLHETSNFIDVYITDKPACTGWNGGIAVIGIQNGSEGYTAPGRNTSDSPWSARDEAWRFAPQEDGAITYTLDWINNTTGLVESNDIDYDICPTETTTYTASVTWISCTGSTVSAADDVTITVDLPFSIDIDGGDRDFCVGDPPYTITTTAVTTGGVTVDSYNWYEIGDPSTSLGTSDILTVGVSGTYVVEATDSGGCTLSQEVVINYNPVPDAGTDGSIDVCSTDGTVDLFTLLGGTPDTGGSWTPALASGTGVFDPSVDPGGIYTYTLTAGTCPDVSSEVNITLSVAPNAGGSVIEEFCSTDSAVDLLSLLTGAPDTGGTWSPSLTSGTGVFDPSLDGSGIYTYTVAGTGNCADAMATVDVTVNIAPDAGLDGTADFCSTDASVDLFTFLGGTPDSGGTWSPALASGTGVFNPLVDAAGDYTYIVAGGGCADATAFVRVTLDVAPNAGIDDVLDICSTDASVDLFSVLGGTPDTGGTWSPALTSGTGVFDPSLDGGGIYTYMVAATGNCAVDDTANITVNVSVSPYAGTDGNINFCSTDAATDLFASLGGTPDAGGIWSPTLTSGTGVFDPAVDLAGTYTYTVTGAGACLDATASVVVGIDAAPDAGLDGTADLCTNNTSVDLFTYLGGTPDTGGTWSPALTSGSGVFDPALDLGGIYTYTVTASGMCALDDFATITVNLSTVPNAGTDDSITLCSTDAAVDLFTILGGTPDVGGTWNPTLTSGTGVFDPAVDIAGNYTYTVSGTGVCADAIAIISVGVDLAPDAGTDGSIEVCTSDAMVDLFTILGGTPDTGGTWSPALTSGTGIFDPAVDGGGIYTYIVSNGVCTDAIAQVTVNSYTASNAGVDATTTLCSTDATLDLFTVLGGTPDIGGTWSPALTSGTSVFDPAIDAAGDYTYTIAGVGVCSDISAIVTVNVDIAPNAGTDSMTEVCSTDASIDLFTLLGGTPDTGGTWSPVLASGTGIFDPAIDPGGNYTYTVSNGVCIDATATIDVTKYEAPNAGEDANTAFCSTDAALDLFTVLGGTPDTGGTWSPALTSGTGVFDPSVDTAGVYTYKVLGTGTCADNTATVTVDLGIAPDAGEDALTLLCMTDGPIDLFGLLGGTPDIGGTWSPALTSGNGIFDPAIDAAGVYTYTVAGNGSCSDVFSQVTVQLSEAPFITNITIQDFSSNNIITVEVVGLVSGTSFGIGAFEYSLDGVDYQSEPEFENVAPGNYILRVRDANGCGPDEARAISIIGAPNFFTPNNDSYNDTWNVINLRSASLVNPSDGVQIFDRFGKLLAVILPESNGWDGFYNGDPLPSGDYWYHVQIKDANDNPVLKRGHFSLIRR
ncbi:hypothetical protein KH5_11590 [Urechidicola sp. KH5]